MPHRTSGFQVALQRSRLRFFLTERALHVRQFDVCLLDPRGLPVQVGLQCSRQRLFLTERTLHLRQLNVQVLDPRGLPDRESLFNSDTCISF